MRVPRTRLFAPSGGVPNNPSLPVLIYARALPASPADIEAHLGANGWECRWRDGIFDYHHFHTTAHETLALARGWARVLLGGEDGEAFDLAAGDVLVLPAGTGHKRLTASRDLLVIGAYPPRQDYEIEKPDESRLKTALETIAGVALPNADPVGGAAGALPRLWMD